MSDNVHFRAAAFPKAKQPIKNARPGADNDNECTEEQCMDGAVSEDSTEIEDPRQDYDDWLSECWMMGIPAMPVPETPDEIESWEREYERHWARRNDFELLQWRENNAKTLEEKQLCVKERERLHRKWGVEETKKEEERGGKKNRSCFQNPRTEEKGIQMKKN